MTDLTPDYLSPEYTAAMDAHSRACLTYDGVLKVYRAGNMDDDVYLAHRAEMKAADATFDVAFDAEAARREAEEATDETPAADDQFDLGLS